MADAVPYSDEDNYANESFENDSDTDIPEISDEDEDEDESFSKNNKTKALYAYTRNHIIGNDNLENTDLVRYTSSSDDEDDVVISETIAEINTEPVSTRTTAEAILPETMQILEEEFPNALTIAESIDIVKSTRLEIIKNLHNEKQEIEDLSTSLKDDMKIIDIEEPKASTVVSENTTKPLTTLNESDENEHQIPNLAMETPVLPINNFEKKEASLNLESTQDAASTNRELSVITETESLNDTDESNFECHITSNTPTSFNTEDYAFHLEFLKRSSSTNKLRVHRKSWTFTNERMREIERQNHILLKKILTQKPTYTINNNKTTQPKVNNLPPGIRMTSSAVNRRKQQRQIDMDNQLLWRKLQAISGRRPMI